jgi:multidrug efflux pump subunit AcrA (membrane-fusion protein)
MPDDPNSASSENAKHEQRLLAAPNEQKLLPKASGASDVRPPSRKKVLIGAGVLAALLVVGLLVTIVPHRNRDKDLRERAQQMAHSDSIPRVTVLQVQDAPATSDIELPGTIQAAHEAALYARAAGYVAQFRADIGARVKAGQPLAVIDAPDLDHELRQARADSARAAAALQFAAAEVARWAVLHRDSVVTREELDQKIVVERTDSAALASAISNLRRMQVLVDFKIVRAPFDGIVTARNVDEGALVSGGGSTNAVMPSSLGGNTVVVQAPGQMNQAAATSTLSNNSNGLGQGESGSTSGASAVSASVAGGSLFRVAKVDTVRIYVGVPQTDAGAIHPGLEASVTVREIANHSFTGHVFRSASAFDAASRTMLTEIDIPNPGEVLLPGMYARVKFHVTRTGKVAMLPGGALIVRDRGPQVAIVGTDSVVHFHDIVVGRDLGMSIEVDSGLAARDLVVVNAPDELRDGQRVRPQPQPQQGAAGGNTASGRPANPPPDSASQKKGGEAGRGGGGRAGNAGKSNHQADSAGRGGSGRGGDSTKSRRAPPVNRGRP